MKETIEKISAPRRIVIACPTVLEEMGAFLPPGVQTRVLDFGLHANPEKLHQRLQCAIDDVENDFDAIVLGYGMCANGVVGLKTRKSLLVVPKVSDCIAIFLGSAAAHRAQTQKAPGTYYLTKGWIEVCDTPLDEHRRMVAQYGRRQADRMMAIMFKKYSRLAYIRTGAGDQERYVARAREIAAKFALRYEEVAGATTLIEKMARGPWDDAFIVCPPGRAIELTDFFQERP